MKIFDVSVPLHADLPVWPSAPKIAVVRTEDMGAGAGANVSDISMNAHSGTHIDAPLHFIHNGKTTEQIDLDRFIGPCQVVDARGISTITAAWLTSQLQTPKSKRLLFKTDNSDHWVNMSHPFVEDFCALSLDAAQWVVDHGIELVGIDYLSIQSYHDDFRTHQVLLGNEVVIVETLDLRAVEPGMYELICLPLKVRNVEGIPARVILRQ